MTNLRLLYLLLVSHLIYLTHTSWTRSCDEENTCSDTTIDCVLDDEDCIISCSGIRSCSNSILNCPLRASCQIQCDNIESCKAVKVNGPIDEDISIYCDAPTSCSKATLQVSQASSLTLEGCREDASCLDLTIYCPPNSNGTKNCVIEGNNNLGASEEWNPMHIYAKYGWFDVSIDYNGSYNDRDNPYFHAAVMHCTNVSEYDTQCDISINDWSCRNPNDYCNHPTPQTPITTTTTTNNTDAPLINIDKIMLPLILSIVLLCCLIGACYVWYKILCVPSKKAETKPQQMQKEDGEDENVIKNRSKSDIIDVYRGYHASSQYSPALSSVGQVSSVGIGVPYQSDYAKKYRSHTVDINAKNRSGSHSGKYKYNKAVDNNNAHYNNRHKKRESSLSSLVVPAPSRQRGQRGSVSSHDRSRSGVSHSRSGDIARIVRDNPFNINKEMEGSGIKDNSEYDPEGFSVNAGDDIQDDDIKSELPESPHMESGRKRGRSSHSDIYLDSPHPLATPKTEIGSSRNDVMLQMVLSVENNNIEDNDSEGSGSDLYLKPGSGQELQTVGSLEPTKRRMKMSIDIATDVSVVSRVIV